MLSSDWIFPEKASTILGLGTTELVTSPTGGLFEECPAIEAGAQESEEAEAARYLEKKQKAVVPREGKNVSKQPAAVLVDAVEAQNSGTVARRALVGPAPEGTVEGGMVPQLLGPAGWCWAETVCEVRRDFFGEYARTSAPLEMVGVRVKEAGKHVDEDKPTGSAVGNSEHVHCCYAACRLDAWLRGGSVHAGEKKLHPVEGHLIARGVLSALPSYGVWRPASGREA